MDLPAGQETRATTIVAALQYLMTHYARTRCLRLAICISRHLQCLAVHPDADPVVRDVCAALHGAWTRAADEARAPAETVH